MACNEDVNGSVAKPTEHPHVCPMPTPTSDGGVRFRAPRGRVLQELVQPAGPSRGGRGHHQLRR